MAIDRVQQDPSPSLGGSLSANGKNISGVGDLASNTVSSPLSKDVFINNRAAVIAGQPATSPSTTGGSAALVPVTDEPTQIAAHTYAQNGIVFYDNTPQGIKLALANQQALLGARGAALHEPAGPAKPLTPATNCKNFHTPLTDADYNTPVSKYFRLIDSAAHGQRLEPSRGLTTSELACRWQNLCTDVLDHIKAKYNFNIHSGFRSVAYNMAVAHTGDHSDHSVASAADISMENYQVNIEMFKWIAKSGLPFTQLILYENGLFLHVAKGAQQPDSNRILYSATGDAPYLNTTTMPPQFRP
jgi:uncharacterized protein YcbK (DUF882 family)